MSQRRLNRLACLVSVLALAPASAAAQSDAPLQLVAHQQIVALVNPLGAEHQLQLGLRRRFGDPAHLLFTHTHVEAGVLSQTSPIYQRTGGYLQVSPIAVLVLRASVAGISMWPIGIGGAGYYPASGYDATPQLLAADAGEASGWSVTGAAILQGAVPLGDLRLLAWNQLSIERVSLGSGAHYFDPRSDAVLARDDLLIGNRAMLLLEGSVDGAGLLRAGLYNDTRLVGGSGDLANQVGVVAAFSFVVEGHTVMPLARAGLYTNGRRALDPAILLGVQIDYDIGSVPMPP